jgi:hypothetical protein
MTERPMSSTRQSAKELFMNFKKQINRAVNSVKSAADSNAAHNIVSTAQATAHKIADKAKEWTLDAAEFVVQANSDPSSLKVQFMHSDLCIASPSDSIQLTRPNATTLTISDGNGNSIVLNTSAEEQFVIETVGSVKRVDEFTYNLGSVDGVNVVVIN